jgi:hypothetical protein
MTAFEARQKSAVFQQNSGFHRPPGEIREDWRGTAILLRLAEVAGS